ncbi:MAG: chromate transporter [Halanaerobium sp. 4-GBenrich]|uniref:Chromate transporter n=1 Tax=Halanaerobium congolense TaxID=54121 RepID=A0A1G6QQ36_9FIRM|nr:chromate transporter [Halanaerobium congolense]KXS48779.1 MAG: chromate transporter [Halanaerobium sp. T82-1]ODS49822.1 MAG: chromate transporter [Halanaerobium sp. 4-GBenrich]OEG62588.1 MAG: chromate transporter [Halanaerobium sp. MDAL1]PUU92997.1 MAG: chromate transporter [Halanaerobium sp.]PTX16733.1 chromate transporter [Halanaerobium congolense]
MKKILKIFFIFFKIGSFTFGGGYAMLPIIKRELVDNLGWIKEKDIYNYYAIGQSTPGIIAVNTATMTGYSLQGIKGALAATAGFILPSLIIITLIASFFKRFQEINLFQHAFAAVQITVVALILDIVIKMWQKSDKSKVSLFLFLLSFLLLVVFNISPVFVVLGAAGSGILIQYLRGNLQTAYQNYKEETKDSDQL